MEYVSSSGRSRTREALCLLRLRRAFSRKRGLDWVFDVVEGCIHPREEGSRMIGKFNKKYMLRKVVWISAAHHLRWVSSPCSEVHGHNWRVTVICGTDELNDRGMVVDFSLISEVVKKYDHTDLNTQLEQPTAEMLANRLGAEIPKCLAVGVQETEGNEVWWINPLPGIA